jgi:hypothetical protein
MHMYSVRDQFTVKYWVTIAALGYIELELINTWLH